MTIPQYGCSIEQKEIKGAEIHSMASLLETWSNILIYSEPSRDCLGGYLKICGKYSRQIESSSRFFAGNLQNETTKHNV